MSDETKAESTGANWPMYILIVLMLIGTAVGVYMTQHHEVQLYGGESVQMDLWGCEEAEGVSCDLVNTSEWSEVFTVPLFTWAIPTYVLIAAMAGAVIRGRREFLWLIGAMGLGSIAFSGFLYYISVYELGYVCLWCMRLYGINFLIAVAAGLSGTHKAPMPDPKALGLAAGIFAGVTLVSVGAQRGYRASLLQGTPDVADIVVSEEDREAGDDQPGTAPTLSFDVKTEDKNDRVLTIRETDAWKGNRDSQVAIVEFADFECGYCKRAGGELRKIFKHYEDRVVFVFKHFPMDPACNPGVKNKKHRYACGAAVAAKCAQAQGKFWKFHDLAFKNQHQLKPEHLRTYAETIGMDLGAYDKCIRNGQTLAAVKTDGADGKNIDAHGTPRIFINGKLYRSGHSAQQMARAIELALGTSAADANRNAAALRDRPPKVQPIPTDVPPMRTIEYGDLKFQIDTFEAAVVDGKAVSGKHEIPGTRMSWFAARDACKAAGKRMCSEEEWIAACQSAKPVDDNGNGEFADDLIEGNTYPYADYHNKGRCWEAQDRKTMRPVYTGEMPACVTPAGVYDLAGNVEEWVGTKPEEAVLLGGAFDTPKDKARCYRRNNTFGPGLANKRTGFRCCL